MKKRGISAVVATVLIILITIAAIAILWSFILPLIRQSFAFQDLSGRVSVVDGDGYTIYDPAREIAIVQIRREVDEEVMNRNRIYFSIDGDSYSSSVVAPGSGETRVYAFNLTDCGEPDEVSVAPIFVSGDLEKEGAVSSRIKVRVSAIDEILWDVNELEEGCVGSVVSGGCSGGCVAGEPCLDDSDCLGSCSGLVCVDLPGTVYVSDCVGLQNMGNNLSGNYVLTQDISCGATNPVVGGSIWTDGLGFDPIGNFGVGNWFTGNFDGRDHKITGLYISRATDPDVSNRWNIGLFGYVGPGGEIKNVGLENVDIAGVNRLGGLVGMNAGGTITNSYSTGVIAGSVAGGLIGYNAGTIINSYSTVIITGVGIGEYLGGLVGTNPNGGIITNSYATGDVTGTSRNVGGLVGSHTGITTNSYATGTVNGASFVGGLAGFIGGTITNSYWFNSVNGASLSGGCSDGGCTAPSAYSDFYLDGHSVYEESPEWDFSSPVWVEVGGDYPVLS